jgi:hypothetical protein
MERFARLHHALLTAADSRGNLDTSGATRILSNFNIIYDLRLPPALLADLLHAGEDAQRQVQVSDLCDDLMEAVRLLRASREGRQRGSQRMELQEAAGRG